MSDKEKKSNKFAVISSAVFISFISAVGIYFILGERPSVSESEKRELETMPVLTAESYFSGEYTAQLDRWYTDTVPFRDTLVELSSFIEGCFGISTPQFYGDVAVIDEGDDEEDYEDYEYVLPEFTGVTSEPVTEALSESSSETSTVTEPVSETISVPVSEEDTDISVSSDIPHITETSEITEIQSESEAVTSAPVTTVSETAVSDTSDVTTSEKKSSGNINDFLNNGILVDGVDMYGEKAGVMLFGGSKKQGTRYAGIINAYKEALGEDVNVYNMVVPTSVEFYLPEKYKKYSGSEKDAIDHIYSKLSEDVISVDAYSEIAAHSDEYLYFRTDHHWTARGAYYAYAAFCKAIGQEAPALEEYEEVTKEGYVGSLYGYTGDITLKNNPDTFTYYLPPAVYSGERLDYNTLASQGGWRVFHEYASGVNMYGTFIGGDNVHLKITSDAGTGRSIVVFKESYGNAFIPYLVNSFDTVYVIDIRYFGKNAVEYIKSIGATDVLFLNNAFAANTSQLIGNIELLYTSPTGVTGAVKAKK